MHGVREKYESWPSLQSPEVGELGVAVIDEEYVGRLDVVLVDDRWVGLGVEVVESLSYVQCDAEAVRPS